MASCQAAATFKAMCNEMRWQQQQPGSFTAVVNWYSCRERLRVAVGGKIVMKSETSSERAVAPMMAGYVVVAGNTLIFGCEHLAPTAASENDCNRRYGD